MVFAALGTSITVRQAVHLAIHSRYATPQHDFLAVTTAVPQHLICPSSSRAQQHDTHIMLLCADWLTGDSRFVGLAQRLAGAHEAWLPSSCAI